MLDDPISGITSHYVHPTPWRFIGFILLTMDFPNVFGKTQATAMLQVHLPRKELSLDGGWWSEDSETQWDTLRKFNIPKTMVLQHASPAAKYDAFGDPS